MATMTREMGVVEPQRTGAEVDRSVDQLAEEEALLAKVHEYVEHNGLMPEALRIADEEALGDGTDRMTLEEINEVINAARAERRASQAVGNR